MKAIKKYSAVIILGLAFISAMFVAVLSNKVETAFGSGIQIINTNRTATSSTTLVTTSSTLVAPTSTDRVYLRISNISSKPIYCTLAVKGTASSTFTTGPAVMYQGITLFASTTLEFKADENPYTGPVYCISEASGSTTNSQF